MDQEAKSIRDHADHCWFAAQNIRANVALGQAGYSLEDAERWEAEAARLYRKADALEKERQVPNPPGG